MHCVAGKKDLRVENINGHKYMRCPLFAGFQFRWKSLNDKIVEGMIDMLKGV